MTAIEQGRTKIHDKYKTILGRNKYSQAKRSYVFKKASDGCYYSDCSSSVAATYRECGFPITYGGSTLPSTVGFYNSKDLIEVPVKINSKGEITNPEILCVADNLLFAGTDTSRSGSGYVGHVEMVGEITGGKVYLYGHGSGTPRRTEMQAYLRSRRSQSAPTKLGHRGLIKVVRHKLLSEGTASTPTVEPKPAITGPSVTICNCKSCNIRTGPGTSYKTLDTAKSGDVFEAPSTTGWVPILHNGDVRWISEKYLKDGVVTGFTVNIRTGPGTKYKSVGVAKKGSIWTSITSDTWVPVAHDGAVCWVSKKYAK